MTKAQFEKRIKYSMQEAKRRRERILAVDDSKTIKRQGAGIFGVFRAIKEHYDQLQQRMDNFLQERAGLPPGAVRIWVVEGKKLYLRIPPEFRGIIRNIKPSIVSEFADYQLLQEKKGQE